MTGENARSRRPAVFNVAAGLVLVLAIAITAFRPVQPPPPVVAEYAPVVQKEIKTPQPAPVGPPGNVQGPSKAGGGGAGQGAAGGGGAGASPGAGGGSGGNTGPGPQSKACVGVGSPPRTTPDPQSPECVPFWTGNNGGATSPGVTANSITVAIAETRDIGAAPSYPSDLVRYFQSRFQTYGRQLNLVPYAVSNGEGPATTNQMAQDASTVNSLHPFADIGYKLDNNGQSFYFYDQLAGDGILSMEQTYTDPVAVPQSHLTQKAPYEWTFLPPEDEVLSNLGTYICQSLGLGAAHRATFAGAPLNAQPRRLGVVRVVDSTAPSSAVDPSPLVSHLQGCGGIDGGGAFNITADGTNNTQTFNCGPALRQFEGDNVTSLVVLGQVSYFAACMNQANSIKWYPEWIASNVYEQDNDQATYFDAEPAGTHDEATGHLIGMQSFNKSLPVNDRFSQQAGQSVDPAYREPLYPDVYHNLMMLFTGIQYAGPNLTPQTFQQGMERAQYPNPGADAAPYFQAKVGGWAADKHSEVNDFAPVWFSPSDKAPDGSLPYSWCYVDGGARYAGTAWPDLTQKLFTGACH